MLGESGYGRVGTAKRVDPKSQGRSGDRPWKRTSKQVVPLDQNLIISLGPDEVLWIRADDVQGPVQQMGLHPAIVVDGKHALQGNGRIGIELPSIRHVARHTAAQYRDGGVGDSVDTDP